MEMEWRLSSLLVPFSTLLKHVLSTSLIVSRPAVSLSYKILGDSEMDIEDKAPLFLFHGLLGCKKHWESLGKTLLNITKRSVVVVDQRNHGNSPHVSTHKYDEMAEDVIKLLDKLSVDKACLVGHHSMGGRTCMCVSLVAPEKVAALLVVDISPVSSPPQLTEYFPKVLNAMKSVEFKRPKNVRKAKKEAKRQLKSVITDDLIMRAVLSNINVIRSDSKIGWTCNLDALIKNFEHIASFPKEMSGKKYRGPSLFVGGQLSDFIPPDDLTKIRRLFPQAVVHYVPKTGHNLHVDDPRSFLEYVLPFFRNVN